MSKNLASVAAAATLLALAVPAAPAVASPRPSVTIQHFDAGVDRDGTAHLFGTVVCKLPPGDLAAQPDHGLAKGFVSQRQPSSVHGSGSGFRDIFTPSCGAARIDLPIQEVDGGRFFPGKARVELLVRVCADRQLDIGCHEDLVTKTARLHPLY